MVIVTELFIYGFDKKVLRTRIIFKAVITFFVIFTDKKIMFYEEFRHICCFKENCQIIDICSYHKSYDMQTHNKK